MNRRSFLVQSGAMALASIMPALAIEHGGCDAWLSCDGGNYSSLDYSEIDRYTFPSTGCPCVITEVQIITRAVRQ